MPIVYHKEIDAWEAKDLSDDEKQALINIAAEHIAYEFGVDLAHKMFGQRVKEVDLSEIDPEDMGPAQ